MKAQNKTTIAGYYGVSLKTLNTWLKDIPELKLENGQRILTPKQIKVLFEHLGNPRDD